MESSSSSSDVASFRPGDVLKLNHRALPFHTEERFCSYAMYCGRDRVIHVWSNPRAKCRVRIDTLRSLSKAGLTAANATQEFDAYCKDILAIHPLPTGEIMPRAREALHANATKRKSTLPFILWARYGDITLAMGKSLLKILPVLVRIAGISNETIEEALVVLREGTSGEGDAAATPPPPARDGKAKKRQVASRLAMSVSYAVESLNGIKELLSFGIDLLLAQWMVCTLASNASEPRSSTRTLGMVVSPPPDPPAYLVFNRAKKVFCIMFKSDNTVVERLVRDRMECGVCFADLNDSRIKLLECSHYLCRECLVSLQQRACPYCRAPIRFVREIRNGIKRIANTKITKMEQRKLAENDAALPPAQPPQAPRSPPPVYDGDVDDNDDNDTSTANDDADEKREMMDMLSEDFHAMAL